MHPIDEKSPFFNISKVEFGFTELEFMIQLKVYDELCSQDIFLNTFYRKEEIIWNAMFEKILITEKNANFVDFTEFNEVVHIHKN